MDLVEIRKKANNKKKKTSSEKKPGADSVPESTAERTGAETKAGSGDAPAAAEDVTVQETVEEVKTSASPRQADVAPAAEEDPLDALFSFRVAGGLATEEAYLQALARDDEAVESDIEQWLTFSLGDEEYALSIECVSEIIKPREVTEIPRVPDFISGVISLRGIIIPVFDLNRRLKLGQATAGPGSRIIICQDRDRMAGFLVDRINQVVNVPIRNIEPPPTVLSGLDRDFVEGVGRVDNRMLILLHLAHVMNAELV